MTRTSLPHQLPELLDAAADLLDHLGATAGLRAGLHPTLPEGIRLLVQTGLPYTDEVGPLDRIGAALNAPITHDHAQYLDHSEVHGTWKGTQVYAGHLHSDLQPTVKKPCTQSASELGGRLRALIPWARQDWTQHAESLHVYDENGTPCVHVVLKSKDSLDEALAALLDATGPLQYRHDRDHDFVAHGSVLLDDGTVVTASVITPK
ncbi:hypothetical protein [Streptomyces sp. NPDC051546]|uniref:hypothetical protein n=1 Tax=Streptomyces sp. NPDC051546 TaxID=3365655 RepID=UPI0037AF52AD